jgi:hypothetical protein
MRRLAVAVVVVAVAAAGCSSGAKPADPASATRTSSSPTPTTSTDQVTAFEVCQDQCHGVAGRHVLPEQTILPGLAFTLDDGWGATWNDETEIHLVPPTSNDDAVFLWRDIRAVKSTGPGAGTQILRTVGPSAAALVHWITSNPDFAVLDRPHPVTVGQGIKATQLTVQTSQTARSTDTGCPANPRCADFFRGESWSGDLFYGIGGEETVQMLFATVPFAGRSSTFVIALDATSPSGALELRRAAQPFLDSLRLPTA